MDNDGFFPEQEPENLEDAMLGEKKRSILVTGSTCKLGVSVVEKFLHEGCAVIATGRSRASQLRNISEVGQNFFFIPADLTDDESVRQLAIEVLNLGLGLDSIVHIAGGITLSGTVASLTSEAWKEAFDLNVITLFRLIRELSPLLEEGQDASILTVGSTTADEPGEWDPHYAAAKASLKAFSKYLANYLGPKGIRVNHASVGPIRSGSWADAESMALLESKMKERIPLGRLGEPGEIADVLCAIDSASFGWVTGASIRLDGGKSRHS